MLHGYSNDQLSDGFTKEEASRKKLCDILSGDSNIKLQQKERVKKEIKQIENNKNCSKKIRMLIQRVVCLEFKYPTDKLRQNYRLQCNRVTTIKMKHLQT